MPIHWGNTKLSREQIAKYAYDAGFRGQVLIDMVAIAWRESAGHANLYVDRPSTGDWSYGLWGLNVGRNRSLWPEYQAMGFTDPSQLQTPEGNARAAFLLYQKYGERPWGPYKGEEYTYNTDLDAARRAVENAQQQGLLGGGAAPAGGGPAPAPSSGLQNSSTGPVTLPSDMTVVRNEFGMFAVIQVKPGVYVHYGIPWFEPGAVAYDPNKVWNMTDAQFQQYFPNSVGAGDARELGTVTQNFGTFTAFFDSILVQTIGLTNPARNDPSVLRVIAEFAARPDMSEAELRNRLKATPYWNTLTDAEREWNDLSEAERNARRQDTLSRMAQTWFQFTGQAVATTDPVLQQMLEQVASGKMGFGAWTEQFVKARAKDMPESPWARQIRGEQEAQRQRGVDIENTQNRVRDSLNRWGLKWSEASIKQWAQNIVEKRSSDDDLIMELRRQAKALYPTLDNTQETITQASPWLDTYRRVMEEEGTLFQADIAKALQAGQDPWEFEQALKQQDRWMATQNGQESMFETTEEFGRKLGFIAS